MEESHLVGNRPRKIQHWRLARGAGAHLGEAPGQGAPRTKATFSERLFKINLWHELPETRL